MAAPNVCEGSKSDTRKVATPLDWADGGKNSVFHVIVPNNSLFFLFIETVRLRRLPHIPYMCLFEILF